MHAAPTARRAPAPIAAPVATAARLEAQLLRAYRQQLHRATQADMEALALAVYGPLLTRATKARPAVPLAGAAAGRALERRVELLDEVVPELLMLLTYAEQQTLAPLLLVQGDAAAFARGVVALNGSGNALYKREAESTLDDKHLFKAAGMGRLSRADTRAGWEASQKARGLPTGGPPLELTPWPPAKAKKPALRTRKRRVRRPLVLRGQLALFLENYQ